MLAAAAGLALAVATAAQAAPEHLDCAAVGPLSFDEPFDRLRLWDGAAGWRTDYGYAGPRGLASFTSPGNGEKQIYVSPGFSGTGERDLGLNPFTVKEGVLTIAADRAPEAARPSIWNYGYVSGLLTTRDWFAQTYGCFEMRARLPAGRGLWPAFWLLNADGVWPPELDILEQLGRDPSTVYATAHSNAGGQRTSDGKGVPVGDTTQAFHVYAAYWTPSQIAWYFDGRRIFQTATPADMNRPMYLLVNLAVGGGWPGDPDASTPLPARMEVDYVRAYRWPRRAP